MRPVPWVGWVRWVLLGLAAVLGLAGGALAAGPAVADDDGYYQASSSPVIYSVSGGSATPLTYAQWTAAGRPVPRAASVTYFRYSWDATIFRRTFFGPWPEFGIHAETPAEWAAAGRPAPGPGDVDAVTVTRWGTGEELFATTPDGAVHHLTGPQWAEIGSPQPTVAADQGYEKLTWAPAVAKMTSLSRGAGAPVSYDQWAAAGFPTPRQLPRLPGDRFYRYPGEATVYYAGPTMDRAVTLAEWSAAGSPAPTAPPAGARPHTVRAAVTPVAGAGRLRSGYTATRAAAGRCTGSAEAGTDLGGRSAAYRCFAGDSVLDPCWNAGTSPASVLCLGTPWATRASRVTVTAALDPTLLAGGDGTDSPWGLALVDGRRCVAVQGTHDVVGDRALDYSCTDGAQVLAGIDEDSPQWRVDVVRPTSGGYGAPVRVGVATAWYPARST